MNGHTMPPILDGIDYVYSVRAVGPNFYTYYVMLGNRRSVIGKEFAMGLIRNGAVLEQLEGE